METQYYYERVEGDVIQDAYFAPDRETPFERKDREEVRYYPFTPRPEDLLVAYQLLKMGQPKTPPRININSSRQLTDEDIAELLQLDDSRLAALAALTRRLRELDLALPSHRREAERLLELSNRYATACFAAAILERAITAAVTVSKPTPDDAAVPQESYFDSWSEGPFSAAEVSKACLQDPGRAEEFHLSDGRSYAQVLAASKSAVTLDVPQPSSDLISRTIRWAHDFAAIFSIVFTSVFRYGR